jgi:hypothetical protein
MDAMVVRSLPVLMVPENACCCLDHLKHRVHDLGSRFSADSLQVTV